MQRMGKAANCVGHQGRAVFKPKPGQFMIAAHHGQFDIVNSVEPRSTDVYFEQHEDLPAMTT